jgi:type I restriction enzyme M protein
VLLLQRKTDEEMQQEATTGRLRDYEVFMAVVEAIGHDKRGNTVFKRNADGEEILEDAPVTIMERTASGTVTARPQPRRKVRDDETGNVAQDFLDWKRTAVLGW